jgi:hypothetical protein
MHRIEVHSKLKSYNINPIVVKYLSKVLEDKFSPLGIAKALYYPRVLGTSINTSFGTQIQKMFVELGIAEGSLIKGMDIEFVDKVDNRKKWCQLKSGPNTINSDIVGVLYGEVDELSMNYKIIDKIHPVYIGRDFWNRITGFPTFYDQLVNSLNDVILKLDTKGNFEKGIALLTEEIANSSLFKF